MAQKVETRFIDDLDGSEASGTVEFGLEGRSYEIDLSDDNAKLREALAPFVEVVDEPGFNLLRHCARPSVEGLTESKTRLSGRP